MASDTVTTTALGDMFVEPDWLEEHLADSDLRVIEVDVSKAAYSLGHIPGAILWNAYIDLRHADYSLLDQTEFASLLGNSGLRPSDTIVFYGYGAYLGFWLIQAYSQQRVLMLNGTRQSWQEAGRPWTTETPTPAPPICPLTSSTDLTVVCRTSKHCGNGCTTWEWSPVEAS
jgi:thiosulfate/3-mercaptopyruvate sulfurtransferase